MHADGEYAIIQLIVGEVTGLHIVSMEIENYRTFRHVRMVFDSTQNYLVGSHNIGKTNFLKILETLHEKKGFDADDFRDKDKPIRVFIALQMEHRRQLVINGKPLDDADGVLRLEVSQEPGAETFTMRNLEHHEVLPEDWKQSVRYLTHLPTGMQRNELSEEARADLRDILGQFIAEEGERLRSILHDMANHSGADVAAVDRLSDSLDTWVDYLMESDGSERDADDTFRMLMLTGFQMLRELMMLNDDPREPFRDYLIVDEKGRKYLPLIIGIDEPEIHQHPYRQRTLIEFYRGILANESPLMCELFQRFLGIDGLEGQLFIVTNSTDCLIDDYRYILRLYRDKTGEVRAANGAEFSFEPGVEKHLIMHFPEVKEALFARSVLIVEGETEYGAFAGFAKTLGYHFDFLGVCLVNARGESSIVKIAQLFERFHLGTVSLYDRDVRMKTPRGENIFFTDEICLELDIVEHISRKNKWEVLYQVVHELAEGDDFVYKDMVKRAVGKWKPDPKRMFQSRKLKSIGGRDEEGRRFYYFAWFYSNKGVLVGRLLAQYLDEDLIPPAFRYPIERAAELAK